MGLPGVITTLLKKVVTPMITGWGPPYNIVLILSHTDISQASPPFSAFKDPRCVAMPVILGENLPFSEMGGSKNNGTPKWMVKIMGNPIKMDDLGGPPLFLETPK